MKTSLAATIVPAVMLLFSHLQVSGQTMDARVLDLETKILLGDVKGRIDHMAVDLERRRLFVAELGNNSVGVVDLNSRAVFRRIEGLKEPQGIAYVPSLDALYVANGGDGSVRVFRGGNYEPAGNIELGDDADNIRVDSAGNRLLVGYGSGGIAIIDLATSRKIREIPLTVHPESFQLDRGNGLVFINLPKAKSIAVAEYESGRRLALWPVTLASGNFPMALTAEHVITAFRNPSKLGIYSKVEGTVVASPDICADADDVFVDAKRHRVYVTCGEGFIDVLDLQSSAYQRIARVATVAGARTSLWVPELDRLIVAARASPGGPAAIWIFGSPH